MSTRVKDSLQDTAGVFIDAHTPSGTGAVGGPWIPQLSAYANHLVFTAANAVRATATGSTSRAIASGATPADGQVDITLPLKKPTSGDTQNVSVGVLALAKGGGTTTGAGSYFAGYITTANAFVVRQIADDGTLGASNIGTWTGVYKNGVSLGSTFIADGDVLKVQVRRSADNHPTFRLFINNQVISADAGQTQALITDSTTLYDTWVAGTGGKKVGLLVQCGTTADDTHGVQAQGTFLVDDAILLSSDVSAAAAQQTITVTLTGTNTGWNAGANTPTFTLSGSPADMVGAAPKARIVSQVVNSATSATLQVATGTETGTLTITDPLNGLTTTISVTAGLTLSVPAVPIAGVDTGYVIVGTTPPGTALAATVNVTLVGAVGDVFTPPVVALSPGATVAYALLRAVSAGPRVISTTNDGGMTNPAPVTVTAKQLASGYTATSGSGSVGTVGTPITLSLALAPAGAAVPDPLGIFLTTSGVEALVSTGGLSLDETTGSGTITVTPLEAGTLVITPSNDGGYSNPTPLSLVISAAPTYTISGRRTGPSTKASRRFLFAMRDGTFVGDVPLVLGSGGASGTFIRTDTGATVTTITLNNSTAPSIPVSWTPPATILDGDADGLRRVLISGTHSSGAAVDPSPAIYDVYDPARWAARMVSAPYGAAAAGQAATIGVTGYDSSGAVVLPHTTDYTAETSAGNYIALVPLPIDDGISVDWDLPAGIADPPEYTQTLDPVDAVNPVLSSLDRAAQQTDMQTALQALVFAGDITTVAETLTNPLKAQLFAYYLLTNSTLDTAGNYIVRNGSGAIIQSLDGDTTVTLYVQKTGGLLTISPHRAT